MARFESEDVLLNARCEEVFSFLADFKNLESLMPEQVVNWQATEDSCSFSIQGLTNLSMKLGSKTACTNIHIVSDGNNPVDYTLDYFLRKKGEQCIVSVMLDAELNIFLSGMASRPLQNLVKIIADKLGETFS